MRGASILPIAALGLALAGCETSPRTIGSFGVPPVVGNTTSFSRQLADLPPPARRLALAVYDFPDLTGQNKANEKYPDYSKAVTQGAASMVINALKTAGSGAWFKVVERNRLDELLKERKLITATYSALGMDWKQVIKSLEFADYIVTGGIVAYDAGITAGGIGATYLGIGPTVNFRRDLVTINLRLVSITDGSIVRSIDSSRTIYSITPEVNVSRYVSVGNLLELHAGVTTSEATQVAVREAIEAGVLELIREGQATGLWSANPKEPKSFGRVAGLRGSSGPGAEYPPEHAAEISARPRTDGNTGPTRPDPQDPLFKLRTGQQ